MSRYSKDPFFLTAKFNSVCQCGQPITKGQRVFYYPIGKKALCVKCSDKASAEFQSAAMDEAFMCGESY